MPADPQVIQLLSEISKSLSSAQGPRYLPAVAGVLGVLLGSITTGYIQFKISKLSYTNENDRHLSKLKAEIITKQRQEWMNSIRNTAKDLLAEFDIVQLQLSNVMHLTVEDTNKMVLSARSKYNLIILMLNPNSPTHCLAIKNLKEVQSSIINMAKSPSKEQSELYFKYREEFMLSLIAVFGETWLQIKTFE